MKSFEEYFESANQIIEEVRKEKKSIVAVRNIADEMGFPFASAKKIWKKIYRNALKQYGDEGKAIATAHSALKTTIAAKQNK